MDHAPLPNTAETRVGDVTNDTEETSLRRADAKAPNIKKTRMAMRVIIALNHITVIVLTIYIIVISFQNYHYLFSWHPSCMTTGFFLLMSQAVMVMSPDNLLTTSLGRQTKVRLHWILQALAAFLMFVGFLVIVINKNVNNKSHFQSTHGMAGLVTIILVCFTSLGGVFALFSINFRQLVRPVIIKLMHNVLGIITYFAGAVCLELGLYSHWFSKYDYTAQVFCRLLFIVSALATLISPAQSAFYRIKRTVLNSQ